MRTAGAAHRCIAERYTRQGLPTSTEQIIVTNGAQQAISLTLALLVGPDDVVLTEYTTWPGLADTVRRLGGRVHGIRMDEHGIDVDALAAAIDRLRPALIALNPHHHNPTGSRLSSERRRAVAAPRRRLCDPAHRGSGRRDRSPSTASCRSRSPCFDPTPTPSSSTR